MKNLQKLRVAGTERRQRSEENWSLGHVAGGRSPPPSRQPAAESKESFFFPVLSLFCRPCPFPPPLPKPGSPRFFELHFEREAVARALSSSQRGALFEVGGREAGGAAFSTSPTPPPLPPPMALPFSPSPRLLLSMTASNSLKPYVQTKTASPAPFFFPWRFKKKKK